MTDPPPQGSLFDLPPVELVTLTYEDMVLGRVVEAKAIVRLLTDGHKVAQPVVDDDGVDLIVDYRLNVQVKATRQARGAHYRFRIGSRRGNGRGRKKELPAHVDVVACHALDADLWWIIPAKALLLPTGEPMHAITMTQTWARYLGAWDVFG